jgi:hypothetical protein
MSVKRRAYLLFTTAVILAVLFTSALKPGTTPAKAHAARPRANTASPSVHERFATFLAGEGFQSVLLLENFRLDVPITVTPALILSAGEVPLDPVTLPPHSSATVDINAALRAHGSADTRGTVVVHYNFATYGPISAVVQATDEAHHLYMNFFAQSPEENWTGTAFDAVVWAPDEGTHGFISIINSSSEPRVVHTTFLVNGRSEQLPAIEIAPRHTHVLDIDALVARSRHSGAGIHVEFEEYPGDILVEGQLFNKRNGFTKHIHFMDQSLGFGTGTLRTHFLLLGRPPAEDGFPYRMSFRSVAAVRNIDSSPVQVTPVVKYSQGGAVQTVTLSPVVLGVNESRLIDFSAEQEAGRLPRDLHHGTLELVPEKDRVSIVGEFFSFNQRTGGYVVGPSLTSYPTRSFSSVWRIDGTFQTAIIVQNTADQEDHVSLKLFSEQGTYEKIFTVPAGELLKINVKDLQQNSVPDKDGHLLAGTGGIVSLVGGNNIRSRLSYDKIVHSDDEAGYVGYPATNDCGDFLTDIFSFVDFSAGPNPFPVMARYSWAQSGDVIEPADGTTSSDPGHLQITNSSSGDLATMHPDAVSHLIRLTSPPIVATTCGACSFGQSVSRSNDTTVPAIPTVTFSSTPGIPAGGTGTITATVNPPTNTMPITLTLSGPAALVSPTGTFTATTNVVIKGLSPGAATLTATISNGDGSTTKIVGSTTFNVTTTISQDISLWFFGSGIQTPSGFTLGSTSATLTANGATSGQFAWTVTAGTSKLAFENGSTSITKSNTNTVKIFSNSFSTAANDVTVRLAFTAPGGTQTITVSRNLTIDSPFKLVSKPIPFDTGISVSGTCDQNFTAGTDGYLSAISYSMVSFTGLTIANVPVNEAFGAASNPTQNNWPANQAESFTSATGTFSDLICAGAPPGILSPQPLVPQNPLKTTVVRQISQDWYVGTTINGSGVRVQSDLLTMYLDHGRHLTVVSPVR